MSNNLPNFRRGDQIRASDLQSLSDGIRANRVLPGAGIRVTQTPNGTTIATVPTKGTIAASVPVDPFQITLGGDKETGFWVTVACGVIDGVIPKINDHFLYEITEDPAEMRLPVPLDSWGNATIYIEATRALYRIESAEIKARAGISIDFDYDPTKAYVLIANIHDTNTSPWLQQLRTGHLWSYPVILSNSVDTFKHALYFR